jgi:hypothetical protein
MEIEFLKRSLKNQEEELHGLGNQADGLEDKLEVMHNKLNYLLHG